MIVIKGRFVVKSDHRGIWHRLISKEGRGIATNTKKNPHPPWISPRCWRPRCFRSKRSAPRRSRGWSLSWWAVRWNRRYNEWNWPTSCPWRSRRSRSRRTRWRVWSDLPRMYNYTPFFARMSREKNPRHRSVGGNQNILLRLNGNKNNIILCKLQGEPHIHS